MVAERLICLWRYFVKNTADIQSEHIGISS